jgi:hypothetical protein
MKPLFKFLVVVLFCGIAIWAALAQADVQAVPNGNYLVTLEMNGKVQRLNLKVLGNRAKCVKSSDPALASVEGQFQMHNQLQNGQPTFLARFRGGLGSQLWILRGDGSFAIREIPDRGEQQSAVPAKGEALEAAKTK